MIYQIDLYPRCIRAIYIYDPDPYIYLRSIRSIYYSKIYQGHLYVQSIGLIYIYDLPHCLIFSMHQSNLYLRSIRSRYIYDLSDLSKCTIYQIYLLFNEQLALFLCTIYQINFHLTIHLFKHRFIYLSIHNLHRSIYPS